MPSQLSVIPSSRAQANISSIIARAMPCRRWRRGGADFVDVELVDLVGVPVDHGGALADDEVVLHREQHQVAGSPKVGAHPVGMDRFVEDVGRDAVEYGFVAGRQAFERDGHWRLGSLASPVPGTGSGVPGWHRAVGRTMRLDGKSTRLASRLQLWHEAAPASSRFLRALRNPRPLPHPGLRCRRARHPLRHPRAGDVDELHDAQRGRARRDEPAAAHGAPHGRRRFGHRLHDTLRPLARSPGPPLAAAPVAGRNRCRLRTRRRGHRPARADADRLHIRGSQHPGLPAAVRYREGPPRWRRSGGRLERHGGTSDAVVAGLDRRPGRRRPRGRGLALSRRLYRRRGLRAPRPRNRDLCAARRRSRRPRRS